MLKEMSFLEKNTYFGVALLLIYIFAFPDNTIIMFLATIIFLITLFPVIFGRWKLNQYITWGFLFLLLCLSSYFWASNKELALLDSFQILQNFIICGLLSIWVDKSSKLNFIFNIIIFSTIIMSIRILVEVPFSYWGDRFSSIFGLNVNPISMKITIASMISFYLISISKGNKKLIYIVCFIVFSLLILLLGSRRSLLILFFSVFIFELHNSKKILKPLLVGSFVGSILLFLVFNEPRLYEIVGSRLEASMLSFLNGDPLDNTRHYLIVRGLELFAEKPFLGWGTGNYQDVSGMGIYSHNNYIELLSSLGIVGLLLYYYLYIKLLYNSLFSKSSTKIDSLNITILVSILLSDFTAPSYSVIYINLLFAIIVGYQINIKKEIQLASNFKKLNRESQKLKFQNKKSKYEVRNRTNNLL